MTIVNKIKALSDRIPVLKDHLETEEATKNALVMPFIAALGWDVFNPAEVIPEFTADVLDRKGEKVDYAIKYNDEIVILFECKKAKCNLSDTEMNQLYRYFTATNARIGVLTNGIKYRFYSDLDEPNKMDRMPFMEIDIENIRENLLERLNRLSKENFDLQNMLKAANELKYTNAIKRVLIEVYDEPDDEFAKYFFYKVSTPGARYAGNVKDLFPGLVKKALNSFLSDRISERLRNALERETVPEPEVENAEETEVEDNGTGIETTQDELDGFNIIKAILMEVVDISSVTYKDTKSYFGVLYKGNSRKPICRLHFNSKQKYLGLLDKEKNETRVPLESMDDLYKHKEALRLAAKYYLDDENGTIPSEESQEG